MRMRTPPSYPIKSECKKNNFISRQDRSQSSKLHLLRSLQRHHIKQCGIALQIEKFLCFPKLPCQHSSNSKELLGITQVTSDKPNYLETSFRRTLNNHEGKVSHMGDSHIEPPQPSVEVQVQVPKDVASTFVQQEPTVEPNHQEKVYQEIKISKGAHCLKFEFDAVVMNNPLQCVQ